MTDFTNALKGAGDGHLLNALERHVRNAIPTTPPQGGERANRPMRDSAWKPPPAPTHPGDAGAAGQGKDAHTRQSDHASGNTPRKGRKATKEVLRGSAHAPLSPSEDCSYVAVSSLRTSASFRKPIGAPQHVEAVARDHPRNSAIDTAPAFDVTECIEGEAGMGTRNSAIVILPAFDAAPLVGLVRTRRSWQTARNRLYLQALSLCRSACDGDKAEAVKLYKATAASDDMRLHNLIGPMIEDLDRWDGRMKPIEKAIIAEIEKSPVAAYIARERGLGALSVATLIGQTGPLDQYASIPKIWRLCGLGVSDDGTKRDALIVAGECDRRPKRAAVYVLATGAIKAGNPDLRAIYDREKAKALGKGWTKARAHNHGLRYVGKVIVRRLWREWRNNTP